MKQCITRYGFAQGSVYQASVSKIKNDRVFFKITNKCGETFTAAYFATRGNMNLHQVFKKGSLTEVSVICHCNPDKTHYGLHLLVSPQTLPPDDYMKNHAIGTIVQATIDSIKGAVMTLRLTDNVYCQTKRCKRAKTGDEISCKIERYNKNKHSISVRALQPV